MERRELDEIDRFLAAVGQASLYVYYGLAENAAPLDVEALIKKRRAWAQGQQSNPKFKVEALFIIKQNALIRKALLEESDAYKAHIRSNHVQRNVESLRVFIRGSISGGVFPKAAEAAVRRQGRELDLPDALVGQQIEEALAAAGVRREAEADPTPAPSTIDFYDVLQADPASPLERLEQAYRARYRWARNLNDLTLSADMLNKLDQAWTVLRDPERRARYDARRSVWQRATDPSVSGVLGLLPGTAEHTSETETAEDAASQTPAYRRGDAPRAPAMPPLPALTAPPRSGGPRTEPPARPSTPRLAPLPDDLEITNAGRIGTAPPAPPPPRLGPTPVDAEAGVTTRTRGPKLGVDGPDVVVIKTKEPRVRHRLLVRNLAEGKMPGRVVADHEWIEIAKPQLDAKAGTQVVEVTVHADKMPWRAGSATLTVVTDHGERKIITFQVTRGAVSPVAVAAGALAVVGLLALTAVGVWYSSSSKQAVLALAIDPAADHVFVNNAEIGSGALVEYRTNDPDAPVRVRIEAAGFSSHDEVVQLQAGDRVERKIRLDLADAMEWVPPAGAQGVALADGAKVVQAHAGELAACVVHDGPVDAHFRAVIDATGLARSVSVVEPRLSPEALACVKRVFRTMPFGKVEGDYASVDAVAHLVAP